MTETRPSGIARLWTIVWKSGMFFVVWGLLLAPLIVPLAARLAAWEESRPLSVRLYHDAIGVATMVVATWCMTRWVDRRPLVSVGLGLHHFWRDAGRGVALGALWLGASLGIAWLAGWVSVRSTAGFSWGALLAAALSVFLNVFTQQLLLCGYLFQTFEREAGTRAAVGLSALLFAGYHAGAFEGAWLPAVNVFLAAVLFCLARLLAGGLWFPTMVHFAWNLLLGPALGLTVSGSSRWDLEWRLLAVTGPRWLTGGAFGVEGGLVVTGTTLACVLGLAYGWRRPHGIGRSSSRLVG